MFKLVQCGPTGGDETALHAVVFDSPNPRTVREFIDDLLTDHKGDWGYIQIRGSTRMYASIATESYDHGKMTKTVIDERLMNARITSISASGGWSRMDYMIFI